MRHFLILLGVIAGVLGAQSHAKQTSVSVDYVRGEGDVEGIKLAAQYHSDYLKQYFEHAELYFETSVNFWEYGEEDRHDSNFVLAISPVIMYPIGQVYSYNVYAEFGIGLSLLSDTQFAGKDVGSHYQFEDRIGLVSRFGNDNEHQLALRYFHYSNAGLSKPNPGLDFISLSYTKRLF